MKRAELANSVEEEDGGERVRIHTQAFTERRITMELQLAILLAFVLCATRTCASDPDPEFLKQGDAAIRSGLFTEAVRHYTSAIGKSLFANLKRKIEARTFTRT